MSASPLSCVRIGSLALVCTALLAASLPAAAQWKWRDARGQIQYSDLPPPRGTEDKDILQRPTAATIPRALAAPASAASAPVAQSAASAAVDPLLEARRKQLEQQEAAKRKAEEDKVAQARAQNCERARAYLRTLDSGQRMARTNEKGEREIIDDATRARETELTRQTIASDCR
jgi:hypothetical protein